MTTKSYRGDAPAVAKVVEIPRPIAYQQGRVTLTINNKKISAESWNASELADAWNESGYPETTNVFASAGEDEAGNYGTSFSPFVLTSTVPGEDFFVDVYLGEENSVNITNETQLLTFTPAPNGGTFSLTFSGQTTGAITYEDADIGNTAAAILAALNALSNIAPGDVVVTPFNASEFSISFAATYLNTNVPQITATNIDLTAPVDATPTTTTVQVGILPTDEVQTLSLPATPTGGTFTLTYAGQTTSAIAFNANAAAVQSALVALSNIAAGDVVCSGGSLPGTSVVITFAQALGDQDIALITGNGVSLTGGTNNITNHTTVRNGAAITGAATRTIRFANPNAAPPTTQIYFRFADAAGTVVDSASVPISSVVADIKALFVGKTVGYTVDPINNVLEDYVIQSSDITVSGSLVSGGTLTVTFSGYLNYPIRPTIYANVSGVNPVALDIAFVNNAAASTVMLGAEATGSYEQQTYEILDGTKGGTYSLNIFDTAGVSHQTANFAYNATLSQIQQAINDALGGAFVYVLVGDGTPTNPTGYIWKLNYWSYAYNRTNITQLTSNEGAVNVVETTKGDPGTPEIQRISLSVDIGTPITGGTFTLTYAGQTTSDLDSDATSADILTALVALSNIAPADIISLTGSLGLGITVTFDELVGNASQLELTVDDLLTSSDPVMTTTTTGGLVIDFFEVIRNQGPRCFDDPLNYDPVGVPIDGDNINFEYGRDDCLWGLKQRDAFDVVSTTAEQMRLTSKRPLFQNDQKVFLTSTGTPPDGLAAATAYFIINMTGNGYFQLSTTLGGSPINITSAGTGVHTLGLRLGIMRKPSRYGFNIGLPRKNDVGFVEYRPRYLEVYADQFILGEGVGNDSSLVRIDSGIRAISSGIQIFNTGSSSEANLPTVAMLIDNDTVDIKCYGGEVGLAPHLDETSEVRDIELYDTTFSSVGQVDCRNITGDQGTQLRGKFVPSGTINLGL